MEPQTLQNAEQFVPTDRDLAHHRKPANRHNLAAR
jgi:hypothetical protein